MELGLHIIIVLGLLCGSIFIFIHLRPLSAYEINELAINRREKDILKHYTFTDYEFGLYNDEFKRRMNPNGQFYWMIYAFERNGIVDYIWVNKGPDNNSVAPFISFNELIDIAKERNYTSILRFHNHPTYETYRYSFHGPSDKDIRSAQNNSLSANSEKITYLDFICERGKHHIFFLSPSEELCPIDGYADTVSLENGKSRWGNYRLHCERLFSKCKVDYLREGIKSEEMPLDPEIVVVQD